MPSRSIHKKVLRYSIAVAIVASAYGCSSGDGGNGGNPFTNPSSSGGGSSGTSRTGGSTGSSTGGSTGSGGSAPSSTGGSTGQGTGGSMGAGTGGTTSGGSGGMTGAGTGGTTSGGTGGTSGDAGTPPSDMGMPPGANPITAVVPSSGCGKDPTMTGAQTIQTMGTKPADAADSKKGPWSYNRSYFVRLPANYDKSKPYNLVFQGPGCGGNAQDVYSLNNNVDGTAISVGLTPPPTSIGHSEVPGQMCFDDKDKYSVEIEFYEGLYDRLESQFCFDKNRVFISGNSSGAWLSNELGCKYAGDDKRPIRGIMPNTGGLPTDPRLYPPCSNNPMAGMWIHEINDATNPFNGNKVAIRRAMSVNKCTIGDSYDNTQFDNFPIGGGRPDNTCRKIRGCPDLFPLVVCALPGNGHGSHPETANPGFSTFVKMFSSGIFITK